LITTGPWWLPAVASRPTPTPAAHAGHRVHNRDLPRQLEQPQAPAGQADGAALVGSRHERAARHFRRANGDLHLPARRAAVGRSRREDRHIRRAPLRQRGGRVEVIGAVTEVPRNSGHPLNSRPDRPTRQATARLLERGRPIPASGRRQAQPSSQSHPTRTTGIRSAFASSARARTTSEQLRGRPQSQSAASMSM
jgi:hypothetical protein